MKTEYFEVSLDNSQTNIYGDEPAKKNSFLSPLRIAIITVVCLACVLALGLGLGLGLKDNNDENPIVQPDGCIEFDAAHKANIRRSRSARNKRWLTESAPPIPGKAVCPDGFEDPPLLVISMDGFRAEYLTRGFTPTMKRLSESGVHAPYMRPAFISKTFPNHYTIMTGLYPESHGIIDNIMYDLEWGEQFTLALETSDDGKWWEGEPMWLTSKRQGKKSACLFWPGCEANITGEYADYCFKYKESSDFYDRIDQVFAWLDLVPDLRPSFISLYFHEPDSVGHAHGPFADEVNKKLGELDLVIEYLMDGIAERRLEQCVNIIMVADHGMGELYCDDKTVYLEDYVNTSQYYIYDGVYGRISSKYIQNGQGEIVQVENPEPPEETLDKLECTSYNNTKDWYLQFYHKSEVPKRLHYANHRRIDDIIVDIEDKWQVLESRDPPCDSGPFGSHGYDNTYNSMHALFMAFGPSFKQNMMIKPFDNIELYNLMAELLGVTPASNNGTTGRLHHILTNPDPLDDLASGLSEYVGCPFPDDITAGYRRNTTDCTCDDLEDITEKSIEELDQQLNLSELEVNQSIATHLPYGVPHIDLEEVSVCQLTQRDHVTGYSYTHRMPLWTAFRLNQWAGHSILDPGNSHSDKLVSDCVRPDVRLDNQTDCSQYVDHGKEIGPAFLYPPGFSNNTEDQLDGHVTSNNVPMYQQFKEGIWQDLLYLVEEYTEKYDSIQVVAGPVFDHNSDGKPDSMDQIPLFVNNGTVPVPSHYYLSVSYCDKEDCVHTTQLFGVVIVHKAALSNCWDRKIFTFFQKNVVRIRDIELLTGITFFTGVNNLTERVLLQTHLQVGLLPRLSWMDLGEEAIPADGAQCPIGYNSANPPVLLISLDGFRNDYVLRNLTPTLNRLRELGVRTEHMRSVYPTMTFPNHYTQVTGLYPESHGIVDNNMYDQNLDQRFSLGSPESLNPEWWRGEPIWNTLELQNKTAMTMFWPGSEVEIQGIRPTRYFMYNGDFPYHLRVDTVLDWLNGSAGVIPDLVTLYFSSIDSAGHETGPLSIEVEEVMAVVDGHITDIMDGLYRQKLHKCVNVIVVSDHGMSTISCDKVVIASDHLSSETMDNTYMYSGTSSRISNEYLYYNYTVGIQPVPPTDKVANEAIVSNLSCVSTNMDVFVKEDLPRRLHYINNARIDGVILRLNDTWQADRYSPWCGIKGQHGWDPNFEVMKAFFLAFGPGFESQKDVQPFENIELYNLLAVLTNVTAAPNNGTEASLYHILKQPPQLPDTDPGIEYRDCVYPADEAVYYWRANLTTSGCSCDGQDIIGYDERLNMTEADQELLQVIHLPHGRPTADNSTLYLLHHFHYITAYSRDIKMSAYTAFTLTASQVSDDLPGGVPVCLRPDVRLTQTDQPLCQDYMESIDIEQASMFPPELSENASSVYDALITTNTMPMFSIFRNGVWATLLSLLKQWAVQLETIHVVLGPVFDYQADGLLDENLTMYINNSTIPIPSHYYAVVLHCPRVNCPQMDYSVKSFILPHKYNVTNCMNSLEYFTDNLSRIRDIELLTGLQFITGNNSYAARQTRTHTPRDLFWT